MIAAPPPPFAMERLGVIMAPDPDDPREAWGVLNPGGTRGADGSYYLFPRLVAEGNYSRIGRVRVLMDDTGTPQGVARLGVVLEPRESYEVTPYGGGVEDPRVTYLHPLGLYVMTYTAYAAYRPRIALAVSRDLMAWQRLGPLRFSTHPGDDDLNALHNKDGLIFPDVVPDPRGRPSIALIHRPTLPVPRPATAYSVATHSESIWISFAPLDAARADIRHLTRMQTHYPLMSPLAAWEHVKIGGGAPPIRLPYGWLLLYHGVTNESTDVTNESTGAANESGDEVANVTDAREPLKRYSAGAAVLSLEDPTTILYRSSRPILVPEQPHELYGVVPRVVFPTATDLHDDGRLDVYYGAADAVIGVARLTIPVHLPVQAQA